MPNAVDIVIAHRGPELGLWTTISSCEQALQRKKMQNIDYKYFVVCNGIEIEGQERDALNLDLENLEKAGRFGGVYDSEAPLAPPTARNIGAAIGDGTNIFFLDNHCVVDRHFFGDGLTALVEKGLGVIHGATRYWAGGDTHFHYRPTLEKNFWGYQLTEPFDASLPYKIVAGGHGAFGISRKLWTDVGGYWDGFAGYGGEEMYFDLKLAMLDIPNWINPLMHHWHHGGARPYLRDNSQDFILNMMMSANIIGGQRWLERVGNSFKNEALKTKELNFDLESYAQQALVKTDKHAKWFDSVKKRCLNEQLTKFSREGIAQ